MPDLLQSILDQDLGWLRILSECWGIPAPRADAPADRGQLVQAILEARTFAAGLAALSPQASQALLDLQQGGGRMLWTSFTRRHGEIREFGSSRRDREEPHLDPVSPAEVLWFRGLVCRAFFRSSGVLQEFAYIPDDLLERLPPLTAAQAVPSAATATGREPYLADDRGDQVLDHACTLLALHRREGAGPENTHLPQDPALLSFLGSLLVGSGLVDELGNVVPEAVRQHLETERGQAWLMLVQAWLAAPGIDELAQTPSLEFETPPAWDAVRPRKELWQHLRRLPVESWIDLAEFSRSIQEQQAEFLRPDGNFDCWMVRSAENGEFLKGYDRWNEVEGAYLRHFVTGPLYWLGIAAIGMLPYASSPAAFRITEKGAALLGGTTPPGRGEEARILYRPAARLVCPPLTPRRARYTLARMTEWVPSDLPEYSYQVTPRSLAAGRQQALHPGHLLSLLRKYAAQPPTPALTRALQSWEESGPQVALEQVQVLRVTSPEILARIRASRAARYLEEPLGPTSIVIRSGAVEALTRQLLDLGLLSEVKLKL